MPERLGRSTMLTPKEKKIVAKFAKQYGVREVYLFGSSLRKNNAPDIDLGVKGIAPRKFFEFYGKLLRYLDRRVDLVDFSKKTDFVKMVEKDGVQIYGSR